MHPEVYWIKNLVHNLAKEKNIRYFIDLHGHSKKYSKSFFVFIDI
jgi:hypothetical protein